MRWLAYFILAYCAIAVQSGAGVYMAYKGAAPNLVLLAVIFIAINAPRDAALLAGFCTGAMWDLLTQQPLGLYALGFGLVALFVAGTQSVVYREHPLTHFSMALVGGLLVAFLLMLHALFRSPEIVRTVQNADGLPTPRVSLLPPFLSAAYTAVLAPFALAALRRVRGVFAFEAPRRRMTF